MSACQAITARKLADREQYDAWNGTSRLTRVKRIDLQAGREQHLEVVEQQRNFEFVPVFQVAYLPQHFACREAALVVRRSGQTAPQLRPTLSGSMSSLAPNCRSSLVLPLAGTDHGSTCC